MQALAVRCLLTLPLILGASLTAAPARIQGPCDIYGAAGTPCVTAHSTTRALYAAYKGPLYQLKRQSDGRTLDVSASIGEGYANAAAHDAFCLNALCVINVIYDQSGKGNHLYQAPPGPLFPGPSKGGFDTQPIADMAPITIGGHKAYGVFIMPGMGLRNNNAVGLAIGDEPEGIYYVVDGTHFDSGCCFDYGNASTNGRAVGTGTMETTYFGTSTVWGKGMGPGPWIMADLEAGLFSGYSAKQNDADPTIDSWRFVTAVMDGGGGNKWDLRGGDAQKGKLTTFYSGARPGSQTNNAYFPMHKQGAVLLGNGGDNGNGSAGTFYEGVMTTGYPTEATTDAVQANIVAARYDVPRITVSRTTTFTPQSSQTATVSFVNTTGSPVANVKLSVATPTGWTVQATDSAVFAGPVAPGASISTSFKITAPVKTSAGFLTARSEWKSSANSSGTADTAQQRVRNVFPVKINEIGLGNNLDTTGQFIELYNASSMPVDISNWSLTHTPNQWAPFKLATIPPATTLAPGAFYLLSLSPTGLSAPAAIGESRIHVRSTAGLSAGQNIDIGGEVRTIKEVGTAAAPPTTVFEPVSTGPWLKVRPGAANLPVANAAGFTAGEKIGIDLGGNYETATVRSVGKAATQTTLEAAVKAGATSLKVAAQGNVTPGDTLIVGTAARRESVKVKALDAAAGIELTAPLKFDHASGIDVSDVGTGITFSPALKFPHTSGDAVQALGNGITLDRPLASRHAYGTPVSVTPGSSTHQLAFGASLAPRAGSISLMDATGNVVVDAIVYGSQQSNSSANGTIASPELATLEAEQGQGGCIVVVPNAGPGPAANLTVSLGRFPDGHDADNLCKDYRAQPATLLPAGAAQGQSNIKVSSVAGFASGQTIAIGVGPQSESAVIASVGTPGATTTTAAVQLGATTIRIATGIGFSAGQTITLDSDASRETAVIATVTGGRGGGSITLTAPLTAAHNIGAPVTGSGITLTRGLRLTHAPGSQAATNIPTPGSPNKF